MTRRTIIIGNWKLYQTIPEALSLVHALRQSLQETPPCDVYVAPPYTALYPVAQALHGSTLGLAAQELFYQDQGAFTGAVSGPLLKDAGCSHVLVAHSERRALFGESIETSKLRIHAALRSHLVPILCVGEGTTHRKNNQTHLVLGQQLDGALADLTSQAIGQVIIAYEPIWAIGTGQVATPEQAQSIHRWIRNRLQTYGAPAAHMRIIYGGSVKPDNAAALLEQPDVDGLLVGGASLTAESFNAVVQASPR